MLTLLRVSGPMFSTRARTKMSSSSVGSGSSSSWVEPSPTEERAVRNLESEMSSDEDDQGDPGTRVERGGGGDGLRERSEEEEEDHGEPGIRVEGGGGGSREKEAGKETLALSMDPEGRMDMLLVGSGSGFSLSIQEACCAIVKNRHRPRLSSTPKHGLL